MTPAINPASPHWPGATRAVNPIVVIPARMASTRLPGKPLADIHGKPMIVHVLDRAREAGHRAGRGRLRRRRRSPMRCAPPAACAVLTDPDAAVAAPTGCTPRWPSSIRDGAARRGGQPAGRSADASPPAQLRPVLDAAGRSGVRHRHPGGADRDATRRRTRPPCVKAACAFDRRPRGRAGAVFLARADPLGRRAALAPYRHLRLPPRRAGALRRAAAERRWSGARSWSNCARWRPACGSPARASSTAPFGVDTPDDLERARARCSPRRRARMTGDDRLPGRARRLFRPRLPRRLSRT